MNLTSQRCGRATRRWVRFFQSACWPDFRFVSQNGGLISKAGRDTPNGAWVPPPILGSYFPMRLLARFWLRSANCSSISKLQRHPPAGACFHRRLWVRFFESACWPDFGFVAQAARLSQNPATSARRRTPPPRFGFVISNPLAGQIWVRSANGALISEPGRICPKGMGTPCLGFVFQIGPLTVLGSSGKEFSNSYMQYPSCPAIRPLPAEFNERESPTSICWTGAKSNFIGFKKA